MNNMASARVRRRDKQLNTLVKENLRLHKDIENLESAYLLHQQNVDEDQRSIPAQIRKEIGGSRWEYGASGKLTTYKVEKKSGDLFYPTQTTNSNTYSEKSTDLTDLTGTASDGRRVKAFKDTADVSDSILKECGDKISDLKTKVLKKAGSKIIRRESWSHCGDSQQGQNNLSAPVEPNSSQSKVLNGSVTETVKTKPVQRKNPLKSDRPVTTKGSKSNGKKKESVPHSEIKEKTRSNDREPVERRSRRDQYSAKQGRSSSAVRNGESVTQTETGVQSESHKEETNSPKISSEVRKSMGLTYTPRKVQPFAAETPASVSNIFPTQPLDTTEIFIDPQSGEVRVKSGHDEAADNVARHDSTVVLIQPGLVQKSLEKNKLSCTVIDNPAGHGFQTNIRDIFGLGTFQDQQKQVQEQTNTKVPSLSSSPFAAAKDCDTEVEFWLRGLGLPDVDRYVDIFAENQIDLLDLEFMSASQLHDMGVTSIGALDKILKGVKDIKSASALEKNKSGESKRKSLTALSIAWEEVENGAERKSVDLKTKAVSKKVSRVGNSCQDLDTIGDICDPRHVRCSSALSGVSETESFHGTGSQPTFAANTKASSAKHTDKRPPSAFKGSSAGKGTSNVKSSSAGHGKNTDQSSGKAKKTTEKLAQKGSNLENKPKKGVLLRPRSSSLSREVTRGQGKKDSKPEEERTARETRMRSRSADAVKRKAIQGVQAAAKKFEEKQQKHRDTDKLPQGGTDQRARRDKMAARHLQREKTREVNVESSDSGYMVVPAGKDSPKKTEGVESLVTVNILSAPQSDPRRSAPEDLAKTQVLSKPIDLQKSLRRVEPARKSSRMSVRPAVPQLEPTLDPPLLSTYKIGGRDPKNGRDMKSGRDKDQDKLLSETESGYRTDASSTYSQVQDKVSEIQLKIKRLKARATSGDQMTLTLVHDLQGQLKQFENQLADKEIDLRKKYSNKASAQGEVTEERRKSASGSRGSPSAIRDTLSQSTVDQLIMEKSPLPTTRSTGDQSDITETARTNQGPEENRHDSDLIRQHLPAPTHDSGFTRQDLDLGITGPGQDIVRMSKKELLKEMRKEKQQHHRQIRQLQTELDRVKYNDPICSMELLQKDIVYEKYDFVGEGMFSKVYKGRYQGAEVAVKCLKAPLQSHDRNYFAAEVSLMKELRHPRVVLLVGVCTSSKLPLMILEYMSQGSLYKHLHDPDRDALDHALYYQIAQDVAAGMNYLHSHRPEVLHLDLKSNNVLLCQSLRAKIADFGFSKLRHEAGERSGKKKAKSEKQFPSSLPWMAPELLNRGEVTGKADVYSFGFILWEMLTRQMPYESSSVFQILEMVRKKKRPDVPASSPEGLQSLIHTCWDASPARRPQFKDILPRLQTLAFPPAWRDLFKKAGVPDAALQNLDSTRKIIDIVSSTLGGTSRSLMNSFLIPRQHENAGTLSTRETTHSNSRQSSARRGTDAGSNWEADTVSTLSGRLSTNRSDFTLTNLRESITEDISSVSSDSGDDSLSLSSEDGNSVVQEDLEKRNKPKIELDIFIPNLELQLQTAREEFKTEREKIERISDWVCISMDETSFRTESGMRERSSGNDVGTGFNLNLTKLNSSRSASPTRRYISDGETLDETGRSILSRRSNSDDLHVNSDEHLMRESTDNLRPVSPKKFLQRTLSETTSSSLSDAVSTSASFSTDKGRDISASRASSVEKLTDPDKTGGITRTDSEPRTRSRASSTVASSKDSFFGIPIHRQAAPAPVMTGESLGKMNNADSSNKYSTSQTVSDELMSVSYRASSRASNVSTSGNASISVTPDSIAKSVTEGLEDDKMPSETISQSRSGIKCQESEEKMLWRSKNFEKDLKNQELFSPENISKSKSKEKQDNVIGENDTPRNSGRNFESIEKSLSGSYSNSELILKDGSPRKLSKHPEKNRSESPTMKVAVKKVDHNVIDYLNNNVSARPKEPLSSRSERNTSARDYGGPITKSLDTFSTSNGYPNKRSDSSEKIKICTVELSEARNKIFSKSIQGGKVKVKSDERNKSNSVEIFNVQESKQSEQSVKKSLPEAGDNARDYRKGGDRNEPETGAKKSIDLEKCGEEKEHVRVKLNPKEVDAKRKSLSESVKLKPIEIVARKKPAITPRRSKLFSGSRDRLNSSETSENLNQSLDNSQSLRLTTKESVDSGAEGNSKLHASLMEDIKLSVSQNRDSIDSSYSNPESFPSKTRQGQGKDNKGKVKPNTIKIKLRKDPLDVSPDKPVTPFLIDNDNTDSIETGMRTESIKVNMKTKRESVNKVKPDALSGTRSGSPSKNTIKVKVRKDPIPPKPSAAPSTLVPPAPPPPPPSLSVANFTRSVQQEGSRMSLADEIKLRVHNRKSVQEGFKHKRKDIRTGLPGQQGIGDISHENSGHGQSDLLMPQQSEGLPSFVLASVELQDQKDVLKSISKPHPQQDDIGHVSNEQLSSIADILRKAVMGRRLAMGEGEDSVSQSMESSATGWSIDTGI